MQFRRPEFIAQDVIIPAVSTVGSIAMLTPWYRSPSIVLTMGSGYYSWAIITTLSWLVLLFGIAARSEDGASSRARLSLDAEYIGSLSVSVNCIAYSLMLAYVFPGEIASLRISLVVGLGVMYFYRWMRMNRALNMANRKLNGGDTL